MTQHTSTTAHSPGPLCEEFEEQTWGRELRKGPRGGDAAEGQTLSEGATE
jgi:hypothetical protein